MFYCKQLKAISMRVIGKVTTNVTRNKKEQIAEVPRDLILVLL